MNSQPNIVLITCDQLRMDTLGCYGDSSVRTPNIDALAFRGTRFTNAFVASPVCGPNRGAMATGRYPSVNGEWTNGVTLPATELTFMEVLRRDGYHTAGAGKMHFEPQWNYPSDRADGNTANPAPSDARNPQPCKFPWYGFETAMISEDHRVGPYADYLAEHGLDTWSDLHSFSYPQHDCKCSTIPKEHHQTNWIADRAIDMIKQRDPNRPMLLWTSFVDPHHPFNPPAPYDTMYKPDDMPLPKFHQGESAHWPEQYIRKFTLSERNHEAIGMNKLSNANWQKIRAYYYGMITCIDDAIGRMMQVIREELGENTYVIFTSDHGEMLGDHHLLFKGCHFEQVTRIPLLVTYLGDEQSSEKVSDELVNSLDLMPSVLDMAHVTTPQTVQGQSYCQNQIIGNTPGRNQLLIEDPQPTCRTIWSKEARLTWHGMDTISELYDLKQDPGCHQNLWDQPQAKTLQNQMFQQLLTLMAFNYDPAHRKTCMC